MTGNVDAYEWLFKENMIMVYSYARNELESAKKVRLLSSIHLYIPLKEKQMYWDYNNDVGYVSEIDE